MKYLGFLLILLLLTSCSGNSGTGNVIKPSLEYVGDNFLLYSDNSIENNNLRVFSQSDIGFLAKGDEGLWFLDKDFIPVGLLSEKVHHDAVFTESNTILFLDAHIEKYQNRDVYFDKLIEVDIYGNIIDFWDSYENIQDISLENYDLDIPAEEYSPCEELTRQKCNEYLHANSVYSIPQNTIQNSAFKAGNWIVSDRKNDLVFIIDKDTKEIVWRLDKSLGVKKQHTVRILDNGHLFLFDNGDSERPYSRVLEIDVDMNEIVWEYEAEGFYSEIMGSAQRLYNGNTLITSSTQGRAFEVTPEGNVVWEFVYNKNVEPFERIYRMLKVE